MKNSRRISILLVAFLLPASGAGRQNQSTSSVAEVAIVVNKTNNVGALTRDEARRIFMGEKSSWPGGKRISVLMLAPGHAERTVILRGLFRMNEADYTKYFLQAAFTGRVQSAPKDVSSSAQMKARLAANPNAIGYLDRQDVDDSVKVLLMLRGD